MKKLIPLIAALSISGVQADERTEILANNCAGCHGTDGIVGDSALINLAGLKAETFIETMNEFRDDSRSSTIMRNIALAFTQEEISAMAKYFESLPTGEEQ